MIITLLPLIILIIDLDTNALFIPSILLKIVLARIFMLILITRLRHGTHVAISAAF